MPYKGGRRKKSRTHKVPGPEAGEKPPSALIIKRGRVAKPVSELVHDLRRVMLPHTAPKLKERRSNSLKDFISVAGPLGISHMLLLSHTSSHVNLRIARMPQGPTLMFRVLSYTLARQIKTSQKTPVEIASAYEHPPLVVLHGFAAASASAAPSVGASVSLADAMKMTMVTFQSMFPSINPGTVKLADCRRVLLVHFDKDRGVLELRHFIIRAVPVGISRVMKKIITGKGIPDLGSFTDISEYVLGKAPAAATSDSEMEDEAAKVVLPADYAGKGNVAAKQSAVKLAEVGPRLTLQLMKIEQGVCEGEVLYHALVSKTPAQITALRAAAMEKIRLKVERKKVQEENVARKTAEKEAKKEAKLARKQAKQEEAMRAAAAGKLGDDDAADVSEDEDDDNDASSTSGSERAADSGHHGRASTTAEDDAEDDDDADMDENMLDDEEDFEAESDSEGAERRPAAPSRRAAAADADEGSADDDDEDITDGDEDDEDEDDDSGDDAMIQGAGDEDDEDDSSEGEPEKQHAAAKTLRTTAPGRAKTASAAGGHGASPGKRGRVDASRPGPSRPAASASRGRKF